jgi:hypothetical protein
MKFPHSVRALAVTECAIIFSLPIRAATSSEFEMLSKEATRNAETKEGYRYQNKIFLDAIDPALREAINACTKSPNTVDGHPGEIIFVLAADGRVKKLTFSPDVPLAQCIAARLRTVSKLPPPPRDLWVVAFGVAKHDQPPEAKGPPDTPRKMRTMQERNAYDQAIAPYIAKARATYPEAKRRFLAGLPPGYRFSVRTRLTDPNGVIEDSFVRVEQIQNGKITGILGAVDIVHSFKEGQLITIPESKIDNWVIVRPDGTEEGNYVGKFLDHYKPQ